MIYSTPGSYAPRKEHEQDNIVVIHVSYYMYVVQNAVCTSPGYAVLI